MRSGYGLFPGELAERVANLKGAHDFGSGNFVQHLLDRALEKGLYDAHVKKLCRNYRKKLDAMTSALDREMPAGVSRTDPRGGLYVWLTLPETMASGPDSKLFKLALEKGVIYVPGEFCFAECPDGKRPRHCVRLSFGVGSAERIAEGVQRLAHAVKECMAVLPKER
jgi:2-aminoadipate transaminase